MGDSRKCDWDAKADARKKNRETTDRAFEMVAAQRADSTKVRLSTSRILFQCVFLAILEYLNHLLIANSRKRESNSYNACEDWEWERGVERPPELPN